jgi:hypothetical protein
VIATRVKVIPSKASTKHVWALVTDKSSGKLKFVCTADDSISDSGSDDTSGADTTGASGTSTDDTLDEQEIDGGDTIDSEIGDEVILIADAEGDSGAGDCPTKTRGGQNSKKIMECLEKIKGNASGPQKDKLDRLENKGKKEKEDRADKLTGKTSKKAKDRVNKAKGKPTGDDSSGTGGGGSDKYRSNSRARLNQSWQHVSPAVLLLRTPPRGVGDHRGQRGRVTPAGVPTDLSQHDRGEHIRGYIRESFDV